MGRTLSKNKLGEYKQGFRPITDYYETVSLPVTSGVAIARGDLVTLSSGYAALETTLAAADVNVYVAVSQNTAAEASADGAIDVQCIPIVDFSVRYMCPCQANTVLVQATHVGNVYNMSGTTGAYGITVAAGLTTKVGFMVEEIDISDEAIAVETYGFAIGRFIAFPDNT